jgi:hypothetical protein
MNLDELRPSEFRAKMTVSNPPSPIIFWTHRCQLNLILTIREDGTKGICDENSNGK